MCGIAGYFGTRLIEDSVIQKCLALMHHRGPDNAAFHRWTAPDRRHVVLMHTRLNIIDLDPRANQPFQHQGQWIVFNGELYNYLELQQVLQKKGHTFKTTSDTEVFLHALQESGPAVLDQCEGMWAFAVYDEARGELFLCRDRFGEKPLYLYRDSTGLYFGSEIKFIAAMLGRKIPVREEMIYRYIINGYKALYKQPAPFFEGVTELAPGTFCKISANGNEHTECYWRPDYEQDLAMSRDEAVAGVRERLIRSVELRLRADVPLAFCMSGGVDSNVLISIAKNVFHYDVHGFTIMNSDSRYEESEMVEHAVAQLGIRHTAIPVNTSHFLERLRRLVRHHDAPIYTITYYAHWLLMESIAVHGYRIAVSGTAADELFTGYYDHHLAYLKEVAGNKQLHQLSKKNWETHIKPIVRNRYLSNPDLFIENPGFRGHIYLDADQFSKYFYREWAEPFREESFCRDLLRNRMLNEMFREAVPVILHEDDLNAMDFSIENRSPFLDRRLFEFCNRIPTHHLIQDGAAKSVLRDAAAGIAPERILRNRRKVGFNAPIFSFLNTKDPVVQQEVLKDSPVFSMIRKEKIRELLRREDLPNSESKFLFYFLTSKMFLEEFA